MTVKAYGAYAGAKPLESMEISSFVITSAMLAE
jgi:hypothetical protein